MVFSVALSGNFSTAPVPTGSIIEYVLNIREDIQWFFSFLNIMSILVQYSSMAFYNASYDHLW